MPLNWPTSPSDGEQHVADNGVRYEYEAATNRWRILSGVNQTASNIAVSHSAANYTAATQDVEAHLVGVDTALGGTAKLDTAQTWTAAQSFTAVTGSAVTISSPGAAQTVDLDGRLHVIELADATETTITGSPTGSGYSSCIVRCKGSPAGTGTIAWPAGHVAMNDQALNTAAGAYTDFLLDSHDGSTVFYRGIGVQP